MATINDIPNEMLVGILSFLSCPDLASTARVSDRFRSASRPLLYQAPSLLRSHGTHEIRPALERFLLTLIAPGNEMLATWVRSLTIHWSTVPDGTRSGRDCLTVLMADPSRRDVNIPLAGRGSQFVLLLHMLPGLQVLHIKAPTANFLKFLQSQKTLGPTGPAGLRSLREFHCSQADRSSLHQNVLLALLQLPCIDHIDARIRQRAMHASYVLKPVACSSRVTKLRFGDSHLWPAQLSPILTVPAALTHFSYTAASGNAFDIHGFMAALAPLRRTLQYLHVELRYTVILAAVEFEGESLRAWSALRSLSCPMVVLLRPESLNRLADVLPPGLCQVALVAGSFWNYSEVVEQVVDMVKRKDMHVPVLGKVSVVHVGDDVESARELLEVGCQTAGVRCVEGVFCW